MSNKRAQLGKIISTVPVLFFVILIMAIFLALASFASFIKSPAKFQSESLYTTQESILFIPIQTRIDAEEKEVSLTTSLLERSLLLTKIEQTPDKNEKEKFIQQLSPIKENIKKILAEKTKNSNEKICFIFIESATYDKPDISNLDLRPTGKDIFLEFDNGQVKEKTDVYEIIFYQENGFLKPVKLNINSKKYGIERKMFINYYFGKCQNAK